MSNQCNFDKRQLRDIDIERSHAAKETYCIYRYAHNIKQKVWLFSWDRVFKVWCIALNDLIFSSC